VGDGATVVSTGQAESNACAEPARTVL